MAPTSSAEALARAMGNLFAAVLLVLVVVSSGANGGSVNDCHGVRYAYRERGLDLKDVPRQPRQGKICRFGAVKPISQIFETLPLLYTYLHLGSYCCLEHVRVSSTQGLMHVFSGILNDIKAALELLCNSFHNFRSLF